MAASTAFKKHVFPKFCRLLVWPAGSVEGRGVFWTIAAMSTLGAAASGFTVSTWGGPTDRKSSVDEEDGAPESPCPAWSS